VLIACVGGCRGCERCWRVIARCRCSPLCSPRGHLAQGGGNFGGVGGGGSSTKGGFGVTSSGGRYTSSFSKGSTGTAGTMTGGSWGAKGSARTSGGSRLYTIKGTHHSPGPRTYYGGHGFRGPRYYNGARATTLVAGASAVAVAAVWRKNSPARYDFYLASQACEREDFFRFGDTCRQCSRGVCPDGQYRVPCTGLSLSLSLSLLSLSRPHSHTTLPSLWPSGSLSFWLPLSLSLALLACSVTRT